MNNILSRYLLREFFKPYLLCISFFATLILIVTAFDQIKMIISFKPPLLLSLKYFSYQIPFILVQAMPLAALMSVLFSLGRLASSNEIVAMRAGGVNFYHLLAPYLAMGIFISTGAFLLNEFLVPYTNQRTEEIRKIDIEKQPQSINLLRNNVAVRGQNNLFYHVDVFEGKTNTMRGVQLYELSQTAPYFKKRIDARSAVWRGERWVLQNGYERVFDAEGREIVSRPFKEKLIDVAEKPDVFLREKKEARHLTLRQLIRHIETLRSSGADVNTELVELNLKFSFPFANFILMLIAVPFGWSMSRRSGVVGSFSICIILAITYIILLQFGHALGTNGKLSPLVAAWIANIAFLGIGIGMVAKVQK